jgi:hypothetical protein
LGYPAAYLQRTKRLSWNVERFAWGRRIMDEFRAGRRRA